MIKNKYFIIFSLLVIFSFYLVKSLNQKNTYKVQKIAPVSSVPKITEEMKPRSEKNVVQEKVVVESKDFGKEEVLEKYEKILKNDPNNKIALEELGLYYLENTDNSEMAEKYFKKLLEVDPEGQVAVNELSYLYEERDGVDAAESFLYELYSKNRDNLSVGSALASLYSRQGRIEEAVPIWERAVKNSKSPGIDYQDLALAYAETGRFEESVNAFQKSLSAQEKKINQRKNKGLDTRDLEQEQYRSLLELARVYLSDGKCEKVDGILHKIERNLDDEDELKFLREDIEKRCSGR